jgi:hypothetical protein
MPTSIKKVGVNRKRLELRLHAVTQSWREIALGWQKQNAPLTSYERLVRASIAEVPAETRSDIRRDIQRSRPAFTATPWNPTTLDLEAHGARLERVLCAWTIYDQEIGYVQAMNLVSSTLLLLLNDEEATFWTLVTLLRQLPPEFYSRAPLPLLGFWTEAEVMSQLASKLLGLGNLRNALLQVAPRWMLEFWVSTLPLETLVMLWDHMLRNANGGSTTPSVLGLQISLVLLSQLKPKLQAILTDGSDRSGSSLTPSSPTDAHAQHRAFTLLQSIRVPDSAARWLMHRAQRVRLNVAAVQDMRLQLRIAIVDRCNATSGTLPCPDALTECGSKPLPLLDTTPPDGCLPRLRGVLHSPYSLAHVAALLLSVGALAGSFVAWIRALRTDQRGVDWEAAHFGELAGIALSAIGTVVGWRWRRSRPAVALGSGLVTLFLLARGVGALIDCTRHLPPQPSLPSSHANPPPSPPPRPLASPLALVASPPPPSRSPGCTAFESIWPLLVCGIMLVVSILQVFIACTTHRDSGYPTSVWPEMEGGASRRAGGGAGDGGLRAGLLTRGGGAPPGLVPVNSTRTSGIQ